MSDSSESWTSVEARVESAANLEELEAAVAKAHALGITVPSPHLARLERLRCEAAAERREAQRAHVASLTAATTLDALAEALQAAAPFFDSGELQAQEQRLERMRQPFSISVASLSGLTCTVEVSREQRVDALCQEVASRMGKKAYRVSLAHAGGRLEPPTATLEACGVTGSEVDLAVSFGEVDPLRELTLGEFLDSVVEHGLTGSQDAAALLQQHDAGQLSEADCRARFTSRLSAALEAAERRRREAEEARRQAEARREAFRAEQRGRLEALSREELLARAREAGLLGGAEEASHIALLEGLSLLAAAEAREAEVASLEERCRERAAEVKQLRDENQAMLEGGALQALEEAYSALSKLRKGDLQEMCSWSKPPPLVSKVLEAMCRLMGARPVRSGMTENWFATGVREMREALFLHRLFIFDKDNIPDRAIRSIQFFIDDETCRPESVQKYCHTCGTISLWVRAMYTYHHVARRLAPSIRSLGELEMSLSQDSEQLQQHADDATVFRQEFLSRLLL